MSAKTYRPLSPNERKVLLALSDGSAKARDLSWLHTKTRLPAGTIKAAVIALARRGFALWLATDSALSTIPGEQLSIELRAAGGAR